MKIISIPFKNFSVQIILSMNVFRKFRYVKLGVCGKRSRTRNEIELGGRMSQKIHVTWRWFPFLEYMIIRDGERNFRYYSDDPLPLKCFIEYEHWVYSNETFDKGAFLTYMSEKLQLARDEILDGCNEVMLNLHEKHKEAVDAAKRNKGS